MAVGRSTGHVTNPTPFDAYGRSAPFFLSHPLPFFQFFFLSPPDWSRDYPIHFDAFNDRFIPLLLPALSYHPLSYQLLCYQLLSFKQSGSRSQR